MTPNMCVVYANDEMLAMVTCGWRLTFAVMIIAIIFRRMGNASLN